MACAESKRSDEGRVTGLYVLEDENVNIKYLKNIKFKILCR